MTEIKTTPVLIAIDHGYGYIKTTRDVFPASVKQVSAKPSFSENILEWAGRMYVIGEDHKEFISDKTRDEDYRLLTMAAVAKELSRKGRTEAGVYLAVGLPLDWAGEQMPRFRDYLRYPRDQVFIFNGVEYSIEIEDVFCYPQGFSAIADSLESFTGMNMLCDIGNGTLSLMYINSGVPVPGKVFTDKLGVYQCTMRLKDAVMKACHINLADVMAEEFIRNGKLNVEPKILAALNKAMESYVNDIMRCVREHEYDPSLMRLYVMGGGACLLRHFGGEDIRNGIQTGKILLNTDIHATAKGYERLARSALDAQGVRVL